MYACIYVCIYCMYICIRNNSIYTAYAHFMLHNIFYYTLISLSFLNMYRSPRNEPRI